MIKNSHGFALLPVCLALALVANAAQAQTTAASAPMKAEHVKRGHMAPRHMAPAHKDMSDVVEAHITALHQKLAITPEQAPAWNRFADTMRANATAMDKAYHERIRDIATFDADQALKSYAHMAQLHADNMKALADSFSGLYAVLSADQKAVADKLFRNQPRRHPKAPVRRHHPHPPAVKSSAAK